jgi:hypothetical protein
VLCGIHVHGGSAILHQLSFAEQPRGLSELDEAGQSPVRFFDQADLFNGEASLFKVSSDIRLSLRYIVLIELRTGRTVNQPKKKKDTSVKQQ